MDQMQLNQLTNTQPAEQPAQPQLTQTYTTYTEYTTAKLSCTPSEQKTIPGTGPTAKPPSPPQYYYSIPLMYNFGTDEARQLNDFLFEGCEMETSFGIQSKPGQSGQMEHSIMVKFRESENKEHVQFINALTQLYGGCAYILSTMKGTVKMFNFNKDIAEATGLKNPVYRTRDEVTGEIVPGRAPSMFLKLFSRGKPPLVEQTLFTDILGKSIPWNLLTSVEMKFIPLLHVKRIYVGGGKASIQMEVVSAVVTSIRARNTTNRQLSTIQRLQTNRPDLADTVAAQLAKLTLDRQEQLMGNEQFTGSRTPKDNEETSEQQQPTFAGITPAIRQPTKPVQLNTGVLPNIPPLIGQPTMQDFTAGAPQRHGIPTGQTRGNTPPGTPIQLN